MDRREIKRMAELEAHVLDMSGFVVLLAKVMLDNPHTLLISHDDMDRLRKHIDTFHLYANRYLSSHD